MPISSDIAAALRKGLVKAANLFAVTARRKASSQNVPGVPKAIEVGTVYPEGRYGYSILIEVNPDKMKNKSGRDIRGAEWAYEYGSGLFGKERKTYPITPTNASVLAFPGSRSFLLERSGNSLLPIGAKGTMFFPYVEHPGVGARPFFSTSLSEKVNEIMAILQSSFDEEAMFKPIGDIWRD